MINITKGQEHEGLSVMFTKSQLLRKHDDVTIRTT